MTMSSIVSNVLFCDVRYAATGFVVVSCAGVGVVSKLMSVNVGAAPAVIAPHGASGVSLSGSRSISKSLGSGMSPMSWVSGVGAVVFVSAITGAGVTMSGVGFVICDRSNTDC